MARHVPVSTCGISPRTNPYADTASTDATTNVR
jgi:hypothetical protein